MNHVVVWKTHSLPPQAVHPMRSWRNFRQVVFTDEDCADLATSWGCKGYFRRDIMNITRADICRYMATWKVGGVYSDLDVTLSAPFETHCNDLCVANEYPRSNSNIANHFFVAQKRSRCLERAIRQVCMNAAHMQMNFSQNPHIVHHIAGPNAFHSAVKTCSRNKFGFPKFLTHSHASAAWHGKNYNGWIYERKKRAGWKHVYEYRL